jgi:ABC-type uncharacterized transport system substrate-binding protein
MTYGTGWAAPVAWIALAEPGGAYAETAAALQAELARQQPGAVEWVVAPWSELEQRTPAPAYLIAIGAGAWASAAHRFAKAANRPVILATLIPRASFERSVLPKSDLKTTSAIVLDQPPARQAQLLRSALPDARVVGLLVGPDSQQLAPAYRSALTAAGFSVAVEDGGERGVSTGLQALLSVSNVLLAIPDPAIFNSQTIANILSAGYRRRVPLVGFSPAYVKAGALLSLYSTPQQVGHATAHLLSDALAGRSLPDFQAPSEFVVKVNQDVARSLGISLDEEFLNAALR